MQILMNNATVNHAIIIYTVQNTIVFILYTLHLQRVHRQPILAEEEVPLPYKLSNAESYSRLH